MVTITPAWALGKFALAVIERLQRVVSLKALLIICMLMLLFLFLILILFLILLKVQVD